MAKSPKLYEITRYRHRDGKEYKSKGTLEELINYHSYTLDCGASWQHEKGNRKINKNPKSIVSLVKNLNNAVNNSAANGYSGTSYSHTKIQCDVQ